MTAAAPPPVRPVSLDEIYAARERIKNTITRTPLVRLRHDLDAPELWLKLETLQPINAFKIRGAANAVALLTDEARSKGVWTISAGNAGQGVAFAARDAGIPCTVVAIETAPETKVERMRKLGARIVKAPFDACWRAMEAREFPGVEGTFVHPFDDHNFVAGNATLGLEILEDLPHVKTVITAIGGGGLIAGVASAVRQRAPHVRILGAEPETAAPGARSLEKRSPQVLAEVLGGDEPVARALDRGDELVELDLHRQRVLVLRALNEEDHQERDNGGAGVDDELPRVGEVEDRAGDDPHDDDADGRDEGER